MTTDPDRIRAEIESTRSELSGDVDALTDKLSPSRIAERQTDKVKNAVSSAKEKVFGAQEDAKDRARGAAETVKDAPQALEDKARGNPWAAGLIAFGAGLLAASLIPASRQEQELVSRVKDSDAVQRAAAEAKSVASEIGDELKQPAQDAVESVKQTATAGAHEVKDTATEGVQDVRSTGQHAAEDVRSEADDARHRLQD